MCAPVLKISACVDTVKCVLKEYEFVCVRVRVCHYMLGGAAPGRACVVCGVVMCNDPPPPLPPTPSAPLDHSHGGPCFYGPSP